MNKLKSPSPKNDLYQVWLKLANWFLERRFFYLSMYICFFVLIFSLKRTGALIWNLNSLHPRMLVEIGPVVLEKKMKLWKVYDNANDDANYNEGQRTILLRKAHLSLRLRWAKMWLQKLYRYKQHTICNVCFFNINILMENINIISFWWFVSL